MNKDLPLKVRSIFTDLDPLIWEGVWLDTLSSLLESSSMLKIWEKLLLEINLNKKKYPDIGNSQFIKWELKAFVAQAVSLFNKNYNRDIFVKKFEEYFAKKGYKINKDMINEIYKSIYN